MSDTQMRNSPNYFNADRPLLCVAGFLFIPLTGAGCWHLFFMAQRPNGFKDWCLHVAMMELLVAAFLFFTIGFLWAVSGSHLLKRIVDLTARKLAIVLILIATPIVVATQGILPFAVPILLTLGWNLYLSCTEAWRSSKEERRDLPVSE